MKKKPTLDEFFKILADSLPNITLEYAKAIYLREFGSTEIITETKKPKKEKK